MPQRYISITPYHICNYPFGISLRDAPRASLPANSSLVRVTMFAIMNLGYRGFVMWAPDCGSWGIPCRGTSMRSIINPHGYEAYEFVQRANCMVGRMLFCICAHYHLESTPTNPWWPLMDLSTKDVSVDSAYLIPELHLRSGTAGTKSSLHAPKIAVVGQQGHLCFLVQQSANNIPLRTHLYK